LTPAGLIMYRAVATPQGLVAHHSLQQLLQLCLINAVPYQLKPATVCVIGWGIDVAALCECICVHCVLLPGSYEYIRRFIVQLAGAEGGHGPDAPSSLPVYDLLAGSASGTGGGAGEGVG